MNFMDILKKHGKQTKYINYELIFEFDKVFNFITSARGIGKTYGIKKKCLQTYIETGCQFIYILRTGVAVNDIKSNFFDAVLPEGFFDGRVWKKQIQIKRSEENDWETCGFLLALSTDAGKKYLSFKEVTTIIYDEFIIDANDRYLKDEVYLFQLLYETVARVHSSSDTGKVVKCYFLGNNRTVYNPFYEEYGITVKEIQQEWTIKEDILVHNSSIKVENNNRFYKNVANNEFKLYAYGGEYTGIDDTFIEKITQATREIGTISLQGTIYHIFVCDKGTILARKGSKKHSELYNEFYKKYMIKMKRYNALYFEDVILREKLYNLIR